MIVPDVNVLIYAHREESDDHAEYAAWLRGLVEAEEPFGCSELALSGFVRVVTNPKVFREPTPLPLALRFCRTLLEEPGCVRLRPGPRHWGIFDALCTAAKIKGALIADAYHAALAIEHACEIATTDSDFSRFAGVRFKHPLRA